MSVTLSASQKVAKELDFWLWLRRDGLRKLGDRWLVLHGFVGLSLAFIVPEKMSEVGKTAILPLAGVLVGLAFAWAGNAMALLQAPEVHSIAEQEEERRLYRSYVFTYQMAILVLLVVLLMWGLLAIGVANVWPRMYGNGHLRHAGRAIAFSASSVAMRECWHVVLGAQAMLLMRNLVRRANRNGSPPTK